MVTLSKAQVRKGLTFCPTPGPPNKAQIWLDFKEFHHRLSLNYHLYYDNKHLQDLNEDELALVDFMAMNLEESEDPYKDIHKKMLIKVTGSCQESINHWRSSRKLLRMVY